MTYPPMRFHSERPLAWLTTLLIVAVLGTLYFGWRDCRRVGGQYVRGAVRMACIRPGTPPKDTR